MLFDEFDGLTDYDSDRKTKLFVQFIPNNVPYICFKRRTYVSETYIWFITYICLENIYLKIVTYSIRTYICPNSTYIYSVKTIYVEPLEDTISEIWCQGSVSAASAVILELVNEMLLCLCNWGLISWERTLSSAARPVDATLDTGHED